MNEPLNLQFLDSQFFDDCFVDGLSGNFRVQGGVVDEICSEKIAFCSKTIGNVTWVTSRQLVRNNCQSVRLCQNLEFAYLESSKSLGALMCKNQFGNLLARYSEVPEQSLPPNSETAQGNKAVKTLKTGLSYTLHTQRQHISSKARYTLTNCSKVSIHKFLVC